MEALEKARGSTFKPFPPQHAWFTFDFSQRRPPAADEVRQAVREQTQTMLEPPIRSIGVAGMRKAADLVPRWSDVMSAGDLRWTLFNAYIFISAVGGTGGGCFRYMFSRFLLEVAEITGEGQLEESAAEFERIGDKWEELAEWFRQVSEVDEPAARLDESAETLRALAGLEEHAWGRLREIVP
jgi:hypothetical protein